MKTCETEPTPPLSFSPVADITISRNSNISASDKKRLQE